MKCAKPSRDRPGLTEDTSLHISYTMFFTCGPAACIRLSPFLLEGFSVDGRMHE